jgi:hypothetical protein
VAAHVTYPHVSVVLGRIESDTDLPLVAYTTTLSLIRSGGSAQEERRQEVSISYAMVWYEMRNVTI